jgi:hypothetical protein
VLTDKQLRNGLINTAGRWPNKVVPFVIDDVFSEYCSTKLQSDMRGVEAINMHNEYRLSSITRWRLSGRCNGDSYLNLLLKNHRNTCEASHINITMELRSIQHQNDRY